MLTSDSKRQSFEKESMQCREKRISKNITLRYGISGIIEEYNFPFYADSWS
jgi:hypothetical protein